MTGDSRTTNEVLFKYYWQLCISLLVLGAFLFLYAQKIDLSNSDLGRHLINGKIFFENHFVPHGNLYSYTYSDFPFINHHWLFGVIFYAVYKIFNFVGVSTFFLALNTLCASLVLYYLTKRTGFFVGTTIFLISLPLMGVRIEVRPEAISVLFSIAYYILLYKKRSFKWLMLLPFLQLMWVNIHIYFPLGILLIFSFILDEVKSWWPKPVITSYGKALLVVGVFSLITSLVNPFFLEGALYPLRIFQNYAYGVAENLSPFAIEKHFLFLPNLYFKIFLIFFFISWGYRLKTKGINEILSKKSQIILSVAIVYLAITAVRNFTIFAFIGSLVAAGNLEKLGNSYFLRIVSRAKNAPLMVLCCSFILVLTIVVNLPYWQGRLLNFGLGLKPYNLSSLEFFKKEHLSGPVFNNYDIGSYLIYGLYPGEKVFVDNRPEAYPASFFTDVYLPAFSSDTLWKKLDKKNNFNAIYFYRHDLTTFGQEFLIKRIKDKEWAPVYVDPFAIILLKRNNKNEKIINQYEIDKGVFTFREIN